jgi:hypothetical protein
MKENNVAIATQPFHSVNKDRITPGSDDRSENTRVDAITIGANRMHLQSNEVIRQTKALHLQTMALLKKQEVELEAHSKVEAEILEQAVFPNGDLDPALKWVIDISLRITGADRANIQLVDRASGDLHIAAQFGFSRPFLDFFDHVHKGSAACGGALRRRQRVMVEDVTQSPIFWRTDALEVLLDARVRAVQSSPLMASSGAIVGVFSTHWSCPHRLSDQEAKQLDLLARTFANCMMCPSLEKTSLLSGI